MRAREQHTVLELLGYPGASPSPSPSPSPLPSPLPLPPTGASLVENVWSNLMMYNMAADTRTYHELESILCGIVSALAGHVRVKEYDVPLN